MMFGSNDGFDTTARSFPVLGSTTTHQLVILGEAIFVDGIESGDTLAWDAIAP